MKYKAGLKVKIINPIHPWFGYTGIIRGHTTPTIGNVVHSIELLENANKPTGKTTGCFLNEMEIVYDGI